MLTPQEFYAWERASRDTIDVKRCYIDLAGDLVSGILLSQIIYWFLPGEKGSKLRVEQAGYQWIAKARTEWWGECRITRHQYIRSIKILRDKDLVFTATYKFAGRPVAHVRLNLPALLEGLQSTIRKADSLNLPKRTVQSPESGQSLTETTTETTSETTTKEKKGKPSPQVTEVFTAMQLYYGYPKKTDIDPIPSYGKEGTAIKRMLKRGFGIDQIISCWIEKIKSAGKFKSMVYVNEDIGEVPSNGSGKNAGVNRINSDDPDKYIKGKYGHMVQR